MPIEIRELVIKVVVEEQHQKTRPQLNMEEVKDSITAICQREVKKQLRQLKER